MNNNYYASQQQAPQLPFNPNQPTQSFLNISANNPPYVPNYQCEPWLQQYLPTIAAALAFEIQSRAQSNPLRMFMFNQYARDQFHNADYEALVMATIDYITLMARKNIYSNPDQAVQDAVPKMAEMLCAINLRLFPGLEVVVDQRTVQDLRNTINNFDSVCMEINQLKSNQQQGGFSHQPQQQFQQPPQRQGFGGQQSGFSGNQQNMGRGVVGQTSVFSNQPAAHGYAQNTTKTMGGKYGNDPAQTPFVNPVSQPFTARKETVAFGNQPVQPAFSPTPTIEVSEVLASLLKWQPSAVYPYYPAHNPLSHILYLKGEADGSTTPILKERTMEMMDYDRHGINTVFGPIPRLLDLTKSSETMQKIKEGIEQLSTDAAKINDMRNNSTEEGVLRPTIATTHICKHLLAETSENTAWFVGSLDRMCAPNGQIPYVYRVYARISDPVVTLQDETEVVNNFGSAKTFIELREKLESSMNDISPELWGAANLKMTALVNRLLRQNMSIPDLYIESFVGDIQSLIEMLARDYGQAIQDAFLKYQKQNIAAEFKVLDAECSADMTSVFLDGKIYPEGSTPKITYLASDYSLTYLNCVSHELELELAPQIGAAITKALTPIMFKLIEGLFHDIDLKNNNFARHLIRTNDGRIMETCRGNVGESFYILTLIK